MSDHNTLRLVCCSDILGFKNKTKHLRIDEKVNEYKGIIDAVKDACHSFKGYRTNPPTYSVPRVKFHWFSDTFILFTDPLTIHEDDLDMDEVSRFFHSVRMLFLHFLSLGFPLRGAIEYGHFFVDSEENIFLGRALIDSYELSEKQDWAGIAITQHCSENISKFSEIDKILTNYDVPLKDNQRIPLQVIDWPKDNSIFKRGDSETYLKEQFHKHSKLTDKRKLKNTIDFLNHRLQNDLNFPNA